MKRIRFKKYSSLLIIFSLLSSCIQITTEEDTAGIDGTGRPGEDDASPVSTPVVVTSIGSLKSKQILNVNGIAYNTDNTGFIIDDEVGKQNDLEIGQVIVLKGTINDDSKTGTADEVSYASNIIGPIESIDVSSGQIEVLGQRIIIDQNTILGNEIESLITLEREIVIQVSGFINSIGDVVATYIDLKHQPETYQIIGSISQLNTSMMTLRVNDLAITYENADISGDLTNEKIIKLRGNKFDINNRLIATEIKPANIEVGEIGSNVEVEGIITNIESVESFNINNLQILTNANTKYENGTADDLSLNAKIEVEGKVSEEASELLAEKIIILHTQTLAIKSRINENEKIVYTVNSTDADKALWVEVLVDNKGFVSLYVNADEEVEYNSQADCVSGEYASRLRRFCYVENTKATKWHIVLNASRESDYELKAYFRRTPVIESEELDANQTLKVNATSGDRRIYTVPAGEQGTIFRFNMENTSHDFHFSIKADDQPRITAGDCYYVVKVGESRNCFFDNNGVENWNIVIEGAHDGNYEITANHIKPVELVNELSVDGVINKGASIYKIQPKLTDVSFGVALEELTDNANFRMRKNYPPTNVHYDCASFQSGNSDEQCIHSNEDVQLWYLIVEGPENRSYKLTARFSEEQAKIIELAAGDSIDISQEAGDRATYRIPAGADSSVMTVLLHNQTADYHLSVAANVEYKRYPECQKKYGGITKNKVCRLLNKSDISDWYITVESASTGSYTLSVDHAYPIKLDAGVSFDGVIVDKAGALHKIQAPVTTSSVSAAVTQLSQYATLFMNADVPTNDVWKCGQYNNVANYKGCILKNISSTEWYVLLVGDIGTSYSIKTTIKESPVQTLELESGDTITVSQEAAIQAKYILPTKESKEVSTILLSDLSHEFNLYIDSKQTRVPYGAYFRSDFGKNNKVAHLLNNDIDAWNILVQSAFGGNYTLSVSQSNPEIISEGVSVEGEVVGQSGVLYKFYSNSGVENIKFILSDLNKSGSTLSVRADKPPSNRVGDCYRSSGGGLSDKECEVSNAGSTVWYILVNGELNTEYSLLVEGE